MKKITEPLGADVAIDAVAPRPTQLPSARHLGQAKLQGGSPEGA
jgi:hypothetical protein